MGLNLPAGIVNLGFGKIANVIEAAGELIINMDQLMYGYKESVVNKTKTDRLMHYFDVLKKGSEEIFEQSSFSYLYVIQNVTEKYNQSPLMYALMKKYDLEQYFNEEGDLIKAIPEDLFHTFKNELDRLIERVHGNYDPNMPILGTKQLWGRALLQFRKWAISGIALRFEKERYDDNLHVMIKGRYRSGFGFGSWIKMEDGTPIKIGDTEYGPLLQTIHGLGELVVRVGTLGFGKTKYYQNLKDAGVAPQDIANLKQNMMESLVYLTLIGITSLIQGAMDDDDDDDEKGNPIYYALYNMTLRLQSDILFYTNPVEFERIIANPIPAMRLITDMRKVLETWYDVTAGDKKSELQSGPFEGDSRLIRDILDLLPVTNQYNRIRRISYDFYDN